MQTQTTTQINGKSVGSGQWKLSSIKSYCLKKNITLKSASYRHYHINYGFDYSYLDVNTGEIIGCRNSDPYRSLLGR